MRGKTSLHRRIETIRSVLWRCGRGFVHVATQPGRHDLFLSVAVMVVLFAPALADRVAAQDMYQQANEVLCAGDTVTIAQLVTLGFGVISAYFIMKFLYRTMAGLDKAGSASSSVQGKGKSQAKGGAYSLIAALLPLLAPALLQAMGVSYVACLIPGGSDAGVVSPEGMITVANVLMTAMVSLV